MTAAGNSGVDIACDAAEAADAAWISMRRGYHIVPKHPFGVPADEFASRDPELPLAVKPDVPASTAKRWSSRTGRESVDLVVLATGYRFAIPYVDESLIEWRGGRPQLYLHLPAYRRAALGCARAWAGTASIPRALSSPRGRVAPADAPGAIALLSAREGEEPAAGT